MPRYRTPYPPEFRRQMVDLVRSGRTPEELAREFEPTAQSISTWVKQAERDAGKGTDKLTGLHAAFSNGGVLRGRARSSPAAIVPRAAVAGAQDAAVQEPRFSPEI